MLKKIILKLKKLLLSPTRYALYLGVNIQGANNFIADKDHWPNEESFLIKIGNHCQITNGVKFFTHGGGHVVRQTIPDYDCFGKIEIGNWVYIGSRSLIMPGVTISDRVLVASGSVVTKSIPSGQVVGGNPARIICSIEEYIDKNLKYNIHSKGMNIKKKVNLLQSLPDEKFIRKNFMKIR